VWVNTSHHQAIDRVAPGLVATAWSPDGIIEAVEAPEHRFLMAVQCHPEEMWRKHAWARRLFKTFVEAAAAATSLHSAPAYHSAPALGAAGE
jgi:putative glutamine amidotransferase